MNQVSCCGKKLLTLTLEKLENEWHVISDHPMTKDHSIAFVTLLTGDTVVTRERYPEWNARESACRTFATAFSSGSAISTGYFIKISKSYVKIRRALKKALRIFLYFILLGIKNAVRKTVPHFHSCYQT